MYIGLCMWLSLTVAGALHNVRVTLHYGQGHNHEFVRVIEIHPKDHTMEN